VIWSARFPVSYALISLNGEGELACRKSRLQSRDCTTTAQTPKTCKDLENKGKYGVDNCTCLEGKTSAVLLYIDTVGSEEERVSLERYVL